VIRGAGAIVLCLHAGSAAAGTVEVEGGRCAEEIHIRAHDAPLAEVLAKASTAMGFRVDAKVDLAERVTLDRKGPPERLLKSLLQDRNLVIQTDPSKACGGKERITTVWILPTGQDVPRREAPAPAAPLDAAAAEPGSGPRELRPRGTRKNMTDKEWQQMKRDYRAGKIKADPETGRPVPVEPEAKPQPAPEAP